MEQNQSNPSFIGIAFIVLLAFVIDVIQFVIDLIPVLGWILNIFIEIIAGILLWVCLNKVGIKTKSSKKKITFGIGFVANFIPFVGSIASWTVDMVVIIMIDKAERRIKGVVNMEQKPFLNPAQRLRQTTAQNIYSEQQGRYQTPNRMPLRNPRLK